MDKDKLQLSDKDENIQQILSVHNIKHQTPERIKKAQQSNGSNPNKTAIKQKG